MFRRIVSTSATWVTVPLRLALGAVFIAHGSQKVLGSFGGPGFKAFTSGQTPFPFMKPPWLWLSAAALAELLGGCLVLLGLLTRLGSLLLICVMLTAIIGVHWPHFFGNKGGFEYPMTLLAICLALLIAGGGQLSVDRRLAGRKR